MAKILLSTLQLPAGPVGPQGSPGPQGAPGLNGANVLPTSEAVAQAVTEDGPAKDALSATFAAVPTVALSKFLLPGESIPAAKEANIGTILQRAVNAVADALAFAGPRKIEMPGGDFRLTTAVVWRSGVSLRGAGRGNTTFFPEGSAQLAAMSSLDFNGTLDDVSFEDFTIDCTAQTSTPGATIKGLSLRYLNRALVARVTVRGSWGTGFGNDFSQDTTYVDCIAIGCGRGGTYQWGAGAGFGIGVGMFPNESVTFINCWALDNHSSGFFFERLASMLDQQNGRGYTMIGCTARGNFTGVNDAGVHGLSVTACHFTDNTMAGYCLSGSAPDGQPRSGGKDGIVSQCVIRGNGTAGTGAGVLLRHAGTGGYKFVNNEITDNFGPGVASPSTARLGGGWVFDDNLIARNFGQGMAIEAPLLDRWQVCGNTVRENGLARPTEALDGMLFTGDMVEPRIDGNTIQGHLGAGINLPDAGTIAVAPIIQRNRLTENARGPILRDKTVSDTTFITGNREQTAFSTLTNQVPAITDASTVTADGNVTGISWVASGGPDGAGFVRATTINTNSAGLKVFSKPSYAAFGGKCWTLSARVRVSNKGAVLKPFVRGYGTGGFGRTWGTTGFRATGDWQDVYITIATPAVVNRLDFTVGVDIPGAGTTIDVSRQVLVTEGTVLWPWFTGTWTVATGVPTVYTSDSFAGAAGPANPRTSDAALGGTGQPWSFQSALNRFALTGNGTLGAGTEPASAFMALPTGFADAAASIKVVSSFVGSGSVCDLFSHRNTLSTSGVDSIGARINATDGVLGARIRYVVGNTATLDTSTFPVNVGDVVWVGVTDVAAKTITLRINGVAVRSVTFPGTVPTAYAGMTLGSASETAWEVDDFIVYDLVA